MTGTHAVAELICPSRHDEHYFIHNFSVVSHGPRQDESGSNAPPSELSRHSRCMLT